MHIFLLDSVENFPHSILSVSQIIPLLNLLNYSNTHKLIIDKVMVVPALEAAIMVF